MSGEEAQGRAGPCSFLSLGSLERGSGDGVPGSVLPITPSFAPSVFKAAPQLVRGWARLEGKPPGPPEIEAFALLPQRRASHPIAGFPGGLKSCGFQSKTPLRAVCCLLYCPVQERHGGVMSRGCKSRLTPDMCPS